MQVLTIIITLGYICIRDFPSLKIKKQVFFFLVMYIFTQLLGIFSESTVDVDICSLMFCCFSCIGLSAPPCAEHIIDF